MWFIFVNLETALSFVGTCTLSQHSTKTKVNEHFMITFKLKNKFEKGQKLFSGNYYCFQQYSSSICTCI